MLLLRTLLSSIIFLFVYQTAFATTYYVRIDGNNNNSGLIDSPSGAWRSIRVGVDRLSAGDTLIVGDGRYVEGAILAFDLNGAAGAWTVIKSQNPGGAVIESTANYNLFTVRQSSYVEIDGFELFPTPNKQNEWVGFVVADCYGGADNTHHIRIQNCYAHDCGCAGISVSGCGDYIYILNNIVRDNAKRNNANCSGISIWHPVAIDDKEGNHFEIRGNVSFENECRLPFTRGGVDYPTDGNGIILDDYEQLNTNGTPYRGGTSLVENNLVFNNGGGGVKVLQTGDVVIRNNTFYHNNYVLSGVAELKGNNGEISVYDPVSTGPIDLINNLAVKNPDLVDEYSLRSYRTFGGYKWYNNIFVGALRNGEDHHDYKDNQEVSAAQQSYPRFINPTLNIPEDISINDLSKFRQWFGLTEGSPAVGAANDNLGADKDIDGIVRAETGGTTDIGAYELAFKDDIIGIDGPTRVAAGSEVTVDIRYAAEGARDLVLLFQRNTAPFNPIKFAQKRVQSGSGIASFTFVVPSDVPPANDAYQFNSYLTSVGGNFNNAIDRITLRNIDVTEAHETVIGEVGTSIGGSDWTEVTYLNDYVYPVVVMGPVSMEGRQPATTRVRNFTMSGGTAFEWKVEEWAYLNGQRDTEKVGYMVVEQGEHTLSNGKKLTAGRAHIGTDWKTVYLNNRFSVAPIILAETVTYNESDPVTLRIRNVKANSFEIKLQEEENGGTKDGNLSHAGERIGYIAIEPGSGQGTGSSNFEVDRTPNQVNHEDYQLNFKNAFKEEGRLMLGNMQTTAGENTAAIRYYQNQFTASSVRIFVQEEASKDSEVSHTNEIFGYAVFGDSGLITSTSATSKSQDSLQTVALPKQPSIAPSIDLYPNPLGPDRILQLRASSTVDVKVFGIDGKAVFTKDQVPGTGSIHLGGLAKGVYIIQVLDTDTLRMSSSKLILQ